MILSLHDSQAIRAVPEINLCVCVCGGGGGGGGGRVDGKKNFPVGGAGGTFHN